MLEIVKMFESIRDIIKLTIKEGNIKTRHVVYCNMLEFYDKMEQLYLHEILIKKLRNNYVIIVLFYTIIDMCHIEILL